MTQAKAEGTLLSLEYEGGSWVLQIAPHPLLEALLDHISDRSLFLVNKVYRSGKPCMYRVNAEMLWVLAPHFINYREMYEKALSAQATWHATASSTRTQETRRCQTCRKDLRDPSQGFQGTSESNPDQWFCQEHWCPSCHQPASTTLCTRCQKRYCPTCLATHAQEHTKSQAEAMHRTAKGIGDMFKGAWDARLNAETFTIHYDYASTSGTTGVFQQGWFGFDAASPKTETETETSNANRCDQCQAVQRTACIVCPVCPAHSRFCADCWLSHLAFHDQLKRERRCVQCQAVLTVRDLSPDGLCTSCVREQASAEHRLCEECGTIRPEPDGCGKCRCQRWLCEICATNHRHTECYRRRCVQCQKPLLRGTPEMPGGLCVSCIRKRFTVCEECAKDTLSVCAPCSTCGKHLCEACHIKHAHRHSEEAQQQDWNVNEEFSWFFGAYFRSRSAGSASSSSSSLLSQREQQAYATLGLQPTKDTALIKRTYKRLMLKHHSDVVGGDDTRAAQINAARDIIEAYLKRQGIAL